MKSLVAVVPEALKETGLPVRPVDVAVTVLLSVPLAAPTTQLVAVAIPEAFVLTVEGPAGVTVPPPALTANVTNTLCFGFPPESVTLTEGGSATAVLTVAVCDVTEFATIALADPSLSVMGSDSPLLSALTVKVSL